MPLIKVANYTGMSLRLFDFDMGGFTTFELCVYHEKRLVSRKKFDYLINAQNEFIALTELAEEDYKHCAYKIARRCHDLLQGVR